MNLPGLTKAQNDEVQALARGGNKIEAIKRLREMTGIGLGEALEAVNAMEGRGSGGTASHSRSSSTIAPKQVKEAEAAAMTAIRNGETIEAIKEYRKRAGVGLAEAKDAVEALSVSHDSSGRINPKLARILILLIRAGKHDEARTQLMTQIGVDEAEAKAMASRIYAMAGPPGRGCRLGCIALVFLIAAFAIAIAMLAR